MAAIGAALVFGVGAAQVDAQAPLPAPGFREADFADARFLWTDDLALDSTVIFRTHIDKAGWRPAWNTTPDLDVRGTPLR